jgi:hypothetical protein
MEELASVLHSLEEEFAETERLSRGQAWCTPIPLFACRKCGRRRGCDRKVGTEVVRSGGCTSVLDAVPLHRWGGFEPLLMKSVLSWQLDAYIFDNREREVVAHLDGSAGH